MLDAANRIIAALFSNNFSLRQTRRESKPREQTERVNRESKPREQTKGEPKRETKRERLLFGERRLKMHGFHGILAAFLHKLSFVPLSIAD